MRIVCDTNVVVSGILFGGNARRILSLVSRRLLLNYSSPTLLGELQEVLGRPKFRLNKDQIIDLMSLVRDTFEIVAPSRRIHAVPTDPDDNEVITVAVVAEADFIVSGDHHLLDLKEWEGIPIVSPAAFINQRKE